MGTAIAILVALVCSYALGVWVGSRSAGRNASGGIVKSNFTFTVSPQFPGERIIELEEADEKPTLH
jgi:hypothetical protein